MARRGYRPLHHGGVPQKVVLTKLTGSERQTIHKTQLTGKKQKQETRIYYTSGLRNVGEATITLVSKLIL